MRPSQTEAHPNACVDVVSRQVSVSHASLMCHIVSILLFRIKIVRSGTSDNKAGIREC